MTCAVVSRRLQEDYQQLLEVPKVNKHNYDKSEGNKEEIDKWRKNCQRCCTATEMAMRGIQVEAMPKPDDDSLYYGQGYLTPYELNGRTPTKIDAETREQMQAKIEKAIKAEPVGSRFIVRVGWDKRTGHVFNAMHSPDGIEFFDGQNGNLDCKHYFREASPSQRTTIIRVDDLALNDKVVLVAKRRKNEENQ